MRSDYTYELRDRSGSILSTGRLTLDERPAPGSTIQLGKARAFVLDVRSHPDTPHLQLEAL
jgi:hypothetical protein